MKPHAADRDQAQPLISRRGLLGLGVGAASVVVAGGSVRMWLYEKLRWGEDFFPGTPPDIDLEPGTVVREG